MTAVATSIDTQIFNSNNNLMTGLTLSRKRRDLSLLRSRSLKKKEVDDPLENTPLFFEKDIQYDQRM